MRPYAQEFLRQQGSGSDGKVLPYASDAAAADMKGQKSSGKLSRAVDGAIGLFTPYT